MQIIEWNDDDVPVCEHGGEGSRIVRDFNLTELHGETEFLRHGIFLDVDGDGTDEIITRTLNANRARAISSIDGSTLWVSPDIAPPPEDSVQISDIAVGDLDEDGVAEVVLASYAGDVICLDSRDGSVKWHRRLPWLINNSLLKVCRITDSPGANLALTVGHTKRRTDSTDYARVNWLPDPSLAILDCQGEVEVFVEAYDEDNSNGHMTWCEDIDGDGLHEVCVCGHERAIWFDGTGGRLFDMPSEGEGGHPDWLIVCDWLPERDGREILYLNGTIGVRMYSGEGEMLAEVDLSEHSSHLQVIEALPEPEGMGAVACNIRSPDSLLLRLDHDIQPLWGFLTDIDVIGAHHADITGDGRQEIICGGFGRARDNRTAPLKTALHVMTDAGEPLYWHRWQGESQCTVCDMREIDDHVELLVSVGTNGGDEGRWSLAEGSEEHLYIVRPPGRP